MDTHHAPELREHAVGPGSLPGANLKRAREEQNIDLEYAAEHLNLSPGKVKALESDDYRTLPNATFVKGYIRSYARFLKIPSQALIEGYEAHTGCNKPDSVIPVEAPRTKPKAAPVVRWVGIVAIVGVVLAAVFFWPNDEAETTSEPAVEVSQPAVAVSVSQPKIEVGTEPLVKSVGPTPTSTEEQAPEEMVNDNDAAMSASAEVVVPEVATENQPASSASNTSGQLEMNFTGDCWVEIKDATGTLIYADLKRLGDSLQVSGQPPLDVKLGNGNMVSLSYNGEPVNFRIPHHNVVRLRLGE